MPRGRDSRMHREDAQAAAMQGRGIPGRQAQARMALDQAAQEAADRIQEKEAAVQGEGDAI